MPFQKGQSGNPGGRPQAVKELKALAAKAAPDAWARIKKLVQSDDERVALAAAQEVLNRAYGKPAQALTGEGGEGPVTILVKTGIDRLG